MEVFMEFSLGVALSITILTYSVYSPRQVNFLSSSLISGTYFYSQIIPYFDPEYKMFGVLAGGIVVVGAIVGGVVGILLPHLATGLNVGVLLALLMTSIVALTDFNFLEWTKMYIFVATVLLSLVGSNYFQSASCTLRNALTVGVVLAVAVDCFSVHAFLELIMELLQAKLIDTNQLCLQGCNVPWSLFVWVMTTALVVLFQHLLVRDKDAESLSTLFMRMVARSARGGGGGNRGSYMPIGDGNNIELSAGSRGSRKNAMHGTSTEKTPSTNKAIRQQRTFNFPVPSGFNYIDLDDLPESLQQYSERIFVISQALMRQFGFQIDNSRNQSEHLLMMLYNESRAADRIVTAPAMRIHAKLFSNYYTWCERLNVAPLLLKDVYSVKRSYDMVLEDMLLYLLIWGEAANLKHMPESICYLLHKTLQEHINTKVKLQNINSFQMGGVTTSSMMPVSRGDSAKINAGIAQNPSSLPSKYPGYYLDMIITPLYEVVSASTGGEGGSSGERMTYDDFNEFFWAPACLNYELVFNMHADDIGTLENGGSGLGDVEFGSSSSPRGRKSSSGKEPSFASSVAAANNDVACALRDSGKTYIEKRSWLHPLLAMNRVFEWHVITFTLLTGLAFSEYLQWTTSFTLQVLSFVFWEITFLSLLWTSLEVWTLFPLVDIPLASVCGYLVRLLLGYLILVYQSIYFHWTFVGSDAAHTALADNGLFVHGDGMFWWWQYIWLSLVACSLYLLQAVLCWTPSVASLVISCNNDFVQAFLSIVYPFSQKYVGKSVHVSQLEALQYIFFWLTLIAFKLWFGYTYIVSPITVPTIEMYDDYMNFPNVSFLKTATLLFVWWLPHFLVYIIDLSIWYSVWAAAVGGCIAIVERQGAVRSSASFRSHFMRAPVAFCAKLMPSSSAVSQASSNMSSAVSTASLTGIVMVAESGPQSSYQMAHSHQRHQHPPLHGFEQATFEDSIPSRPIASQQSKKKSPRAKSSADLLTAGIMHKHQTVGQEQDLLLDSVRDTDMLNPQNVSEFLDVRSQRWTVFALVWNEIVTQLQRTDYVSEEERDWFLFTYFPWLGKPVYLPLYMTAGCVNIAVVAFADAHAAYIRESGANEKLKVADKFNTSLSVCAVDATGEAWELTYWFLQKLLGPKHKDDTDKIINKLIHWASAGDLLSSMNAEKAQSLVDRVANIIGFLLPVVGKRCDEPVLSKEFLAKQQQELQSGASASTKRHTLNEWTIEQARSGGGSSGSGGGSGSMKKSVSTGFLSSLNDHAELEASAAADASASTVVKPTSKKMNKNFTKLLPFIKNNVLQDNTRDRIREELRMLFHDLRSSLKEAEGRNDRGEPPGRSLIDSITFILSLESGFLWSDMYASLQLDEFCRDKDKVRGVLGKLNGLLRLRVTQVELSSYEARRRLNFFLNSLFMDMPSVPSSRYAKEYTCITPYYSEDILLSQKDLEAVNSDNISTLLYLQTLHKEDWRNLLKRCNIKDEQQIWRDKNLTQSVREWASLRAQTLYRTVEGMMYTEKAVRMFAELEELSASTVEVLAKLKFNYVVACQVYGHMKRTLDSKADDIDYLLTKYPNLRVAYIDSVRVNRNEEDMAYYSVLIKSDGGSLGDKTTPARINIKEVYRIKLPGNPVLGEGKPENQNHALIFTRGRYLQAVDMNQDGYFEEALKMRNLLEEFDHQEGCSILGFKEHIFTGSVSSIANYMAMQELSFVTLGQRVLTKPLCIRQHYGHPDLFNKFFVMTEGGMSKASKGINLSEDVFAGFNATIRGHRVNFKEYVQVGKGRDVGLQQTYKFEAKLSQGNAEQSLSRDLDRICNRLDFFRLLSFYYGGIGHYMANTLVMFTLVVVVYTMLAVALFGVEGVGGRPMHPEGVLQMLMAGMGLLQTAPLIVTLTVEKGVLQAFSEVAFMILSGGPLYFIFHIQTKCYYFSQTLLAGGAKYRPTGRGFVTRHSPFDENYRFFATSHIYLGFELLVALILFAVYTTSTQYWGLTWALWLAVVSFLLGPFWFNPMSFEWGPLLEDYKRFVSWMQEVGGSSEQSWDAWWREENAYVDSLSYSWRFFLIALKCVIWSLIAVGLASLKFFSEPNQQKRVLELVGLVGLFFCGHWMLNKLERQVSYPVRRFVSLTLSTAVLVAIVALFVLHTSYIRYTVAVYYFVGALSYLVFILGGRNQIQPLYKLHDYLVAHTIFALLAVLTALQLQYFQKRLLYHNALSEGVEIKDVLSYVRRSKAKNDTHQISELRTQVTRQEAIIQTLLAAKKQYDEEAHHHHALSVPKEVELVDKIQAKPSPKGTEPGVAVQGIFQPLKLSIPAMPKPVSRATSETTQVGTGGPVSILRGATRGMSSGANSPNVRSESPATRTFTSSPRSKPSGTETVLKTSIGERDNSSIDSLTREVSFSGVTKQGVSGAASPMIPNSSSWLSAEGSGKVSTSSASIDTKGSTAVPTTDWTFTQPVSLPPR